MASLGVRALKFLEVKMIIRIWGRTVHNQKQNDPISITEELKTAFSTRPCFGIDIRGSTNVMRVRDGLEVREDGYLFF